jgi:hypothetical protein
MRITPAIANFRRASVADQAAETLRQAIHEGTLVDPLPGEHQLARDLGISRPSLRIAMARLGAEGLIIRSNGRRSRLNTDLHRPKRNIPPMIRVVCPASREKSALDQHPILLEMHAYFATKRIGWEEIFDAKLAGAHPERLLRTLVLGRKHSCWLLLACPEPVHRWFKNAGVPVFSLGSGHPGIEIPSIDINYRAVGWHAAGSIIKNGHKHVALLQPYRVNAGDRDSCDGFRSYIAKHAANVKVTSISISADQSDLPGKLAHLAAARSRPTAIFSLIPEHTLTAMVHLPRCGLRIPNDISLVSRDTLPLIDTALPEISRYRSSYVDLTHRAERIAQALLAGRPVAAKPSMIIPAFIPGQTLAAPPATAINTR